MTIDEAIKEQQLYLNHSDQWSHEKIDDALKLGIEALKLIKKQRAIPGYDSGYPLPGETE